MKKGKAIRFKRNGEPYEKGGLSKCSQYDFVAILKPWLLWLKEKQIINIPENEIIKKVRPPKPGDPTERLNANDIPTFKEIEELIKATLTIRDRALISVMYESGARIGEIGRAVWDDAIIDEYGVKFYITDTKTKKRRYSRLTISNAALSTWKDRHPAPYGNNFIFINDDNKPMTYIGIKRVLDRALARAKIEKKITPHMLRHARATHMIQQNYQESTIKKSLWNNLNSKMFQTYVTLGEQDIDNEFLRRAGVKIPEDQDKKDLLIPRTCGICHFINSPDSQYCNKCGNPVSIEAQQNVKKSQNTIEKILAEMKPEERAGFMEKIIMEMLKEQN
jgi:integrase